MPGVGQKSERFLVWMIRADAVAFGEQLAAKLRGVATWRALAPGFGVGAKHKKLGELLPEWGGGAILQLDSGGPGLQYLQGYLRNSVGKLITAPQQGGVLWSSELAYQWFPEESSEYLGTFPAFIKTVKQVLYQCTAANRVKLRGKPYRKSRIGKLAERYVLEHDLQIKDENRPTGSCLDLVVRE